MTISRRATLRGTTSIGRVLTDWRTGARHALLGHPQLGPAYLKVNPLYRPRTLRLATRIVIDGYPRSANSYAMFAFLQANPCRQAFAGHSHSPHLLKLAGERGLPAVVLLREPGAACASYAQYLSTPNLALLLDAWTDFHRVLRPVADRLLVAPFGTVTTDFGSVIEACNLRYGTDFALYRPSEENERAVRLRVDHGARFWGRQQPHRVARPEASRRSSRDVLDHVDNRTRSALDRATETYRDLQAHAPFPQAT